MKEKPKTAYDVRRYLTLVQVLAMPNLVKQSEMLQTLYREWGLSLTVYEREHKDTLIRALAQHVVKYHQTETKTNE